MSNEGLPVNRQGEGAHAVPDRPRQVDPKRRTGVLLVPQRLGQGDVDELGAAWGQIGPVVRHLQAR
jgi:hypothetical protein